MKPHLHLFRNILALVIAITTPAFVNAQALDITITNQQNSSCNGICDGSLTATASGGTGSYTYLWSQGASTQTINNLCAGTYTCYVTDQAPSTDSVVVTLFQPTVLTLNVTVSNACSNGSCNGSAYANVSGGTAPYSCFWSNGVTTFSNNALCPGTYTCSVTDANGCNVNAGVTIFANLPAPVIDSIVATPDDTLASCASCITLTAYVSGVGGATYNWTNCGLFAASNPVQVCNLQFSCTTTLTVTGPNGCVEYGLKSIYAPAQITSVTGIVKADSCNLCIGDVHNLNVNGGTGPYTYSWAGPYNFSSSLQNVSGLCGGTYTLTVTDSLQCTKVQNFTSGNALNAFLSVSGTNPNCPNTCTGNATAAYTGPNAPYTYQWNTVPPQSTATATNLCPGTYTCTVIDSAGCMASIAKIISSQVNAPTINPSGTTQPTCGMCNGSFYIPNSFGYTTSVTGPNNYISSGPWHTNLCAGTYTVTSTRSGCTTYTNTVVLLLQSGAMPGLTLTPTITGESCIGMHDGSISLATSGVSSPLTFLWSNYFQTQNIGNLVAGNYIVTITDTNNNCHKQTISVPLTSTNCGYVNGKVFADLNNDCTDNLADYGIQGSVIMASPGPYYGYTNNAGNYNITLPLGNYNLQHFVNQSGYGATCVTTQTVSLSTGSNTAGNIDFSDTIVPLPDLSAGFIYASQPVPGFGQSIGFSVHNSSVFYSNPLDGVVKFVLQSDQYFNNANPAPSQISGDTLIWNFTGLNTFQTLNYSVNVTVAADPSLIGTWFTNCLSVTCTNETDMVPVNNGWCQNSYIMGAFDPNDKTVAPRGEGVNGDIPLTDSVFVYTVRFQNTGNAPAHNVVVLDTISSKLDLTTFQLVGSSHSCEVDFLAGDAARFSFINIMLPDSFNDEPNSHGWFQYRIKRKTGTGLGDQVFNTAHIYFDFNPAIVTNTTTNTYTSITSVKASENKPEILIYPNPAQHVLYLRESANKKIEGVEIYDLGGKLVLAQQFNQPFVAMSLSPLAKGVYMVKVTTQNGLSAMKKIVVMK
jgi:uncharacterized repeat protein (TIGR01451 family)